MASIFEGIDMSDPCAVYPKLEEVLTRVVAGEGIVKIEFDEDVVEYNRTNIAELRRRINELKGQCAARSGASSRRALRAKF